MAIKFSDMVSMPTWAIAYIENGDGSALNEEEEAMIDQWVAKYNRPTFECDTNEFFSHYPAFGLGSTCVDCNVFEEK